MTHEMPSTLIDSTEHVHDVAELRRRMAEDGYLRLRGFLAPEVVAVVRDDLVASATEAGWIAADGRAVASAKCSDPDPRYAVVGDRWFRSEPLHRLLHQPRVVGLVRELFGEPVLPHPKPNVRGYFPGHATRPHHDYFVDQGTVRQWTAWVPLVDCPRGMGGLELAAGSHRLALPIGPLRDELVDALRWQGDDLAAGDLILFDVRTVHRAPPNATDRLRLSVDMRYQPRSEPISVAALVHRDWPAVYRDWQSTACQYYWRRWPLVVQSLDPAVVARAAAMLEAAGDDGAPSLRAQRWEHAADDQRRMT